MSSVEQLLEHMRHSKAGWTADDLEKVYVGLGFKYREGGKHRIYFHPVYHELRATVTRSRSLPKSYIDHALYLADRLKQLESENEKSS